MTGIADIRAAVIGTGFIGTVHVECAAASASRSRGVLGSTPERGAARAAALGVGHAYPSLDAILDDPAVDVVHVTSPNHLHVPAGAGDPRRRQARRVREAAGADRGRVGGAGRGCRGGPASSTRSTSTSGSTRSTSTSASSSPTAAGRRPVRDRPLLPGLAVPRHRLELAPRARTRAARFGPSATSARTGSTSSSS